MPAPRSISPKQAHAALRRKSAAAERNFKSLRSTASRYAVIEAALLRVHRGKLLRAISADAIAVGAGCRRHTASGGGGHSYQGEQPALVVYVANRQEAASVPAQRRVPSSLTMTLSLQGRRRTYAVPTDVRTHPDRALAHQLPCRVTVTTNAADGNGTRGSMCARVRLAGQTAPLYALTCHHVAWCSEERANLAADPSADNWSEEAGEVQGPHLGKPQFKSDFAPGSQDCIDAALVALDAAGPGMSAAFWPVQIVGVIGDRVSLLAKWAQGAALYSRYFPEGVALNPPTVRLSYPVGYDCGASATIEELLEYSCLAGGPQAGDSGGAIVAADGTLLAMHTAGEASQGLGYAQPAYLLFSPGTFGSGVAISLA